MGGTEQGGAVELRIVQQKVVVRGGSLEGTLACELESPSVHGSASRRTPQYIDSAYPALAAALGLDADAGLPILGDYSNQTWAAAFFSLALRPLIVGHNVDFAWPDWQQGEWTRMLGLPPTPWLSYLFASSPQLARPPSLAPAVLRDDGALARASSFPARSLVLNRWGGLGSHRYPVGFSGEGAVSSSLEEGMLHFMIAVMSQATPRRRGRC